MNVPLKYNIRSILTVGAGVILSGLVLSAVVGVVAGSCPPAERRARRSSTPCDTREPA